MTISPESLRADERAIFRRICAKHSTRAGRLFQAKEVGVESVPTGAALIGLLSLGVIFRRTYRGGGSRYYLTLEGRCLAAAMYPPIGDPNYPKPKEDGK